MPTPLPLHSVKPGDVIGVMAPSSTVNRRDIEASQALLKARGFEAFVHPQTYAHNGQIAGTREEKRDALHALYADTRIKAIWAAGGGNRALDLIDGLDYALIKANAKPLIGFSDVTALLNAIYAHTGLMGIHGPVFKQLATHAYTEHTLELLSSDAPATLGYGFARRECERRAHWWEFECVSVSARNAA
jgi:muramoyltetrapeptide carboxypeptidase